MSTTNQPEIQMTVTPVAGAATGTPRWVAPSPARARPGAARAVAKRMHTARAATRVRPSLRLREHTEHAF